MYKYSTIYMYTYMYMYMYTNNLLITNSLGELYVPYKYSDEY